MTRGKCRYGPRHESVCLVGDEWLGEATYEYTCWLAPTDPCPTCDGTGRVELSPEEDGMERADVASRTRDKPCSSCHGQGYVPGPHWPYRWPQPPPLRRESL